MVVVLVVDWRVDFNNGSVVVSVAEPACFLVCVAACGLVRPDRDGTLLDLVLGDFFFLPFRALLGMSVFVCVVEATPRVVSVFSAALVRVEGSAVWVTRVWSALLRVEGSAVWVTRSELLRVGGVFRLLLHFFHFFRLGRKVSPRGEAQRPGGPFGFGFLRSFPFVEEGIVCGGTFSATAGLREATC